jgi:hypothetical protein
MILFSKLMTKFLIIHFLLVHGALVHLKGKRTDHNWGRYVLLHRADISRYNPAPPMKGGCSGSGDCGGMNN